MRHLWGLAGYHQTQRGQRSSFLGYRCGAKMALIKDSKSKKESEEENKYLNPPEHICLWVDWGVGR